jgi:hypothetical protein
MPTARDLTPEQLARYRAAARSRQQQETEALARREARVWKSPTAPAELPDGHRMEPKLSFRYDRQADILHIDKRPPYPEQETEELGDDVVARLNPITNQVENLEVLFFSTRLLRAELFELPVDADLRLAVTR